MCSSYVQVTVLVPLNPSARPLRTDLRAEAHQRLQLGDTLGAELELWVKVLHLLIFRK